MNAKLYTVPKVGDEIYVPTSLYLGHGADDFEGGIATVSRVKLGLCAGDQTPFVSVRERPGHHYNWEVLAEQQDELKKEYGKRRAYPDPDMRPEFNRGW